MIIKDESITIIIINKDDDFSSKRFISFFPPLTVYNHFQVCVKMNDFDFKKNSGHTQKKFYFYLFFYIYYKTTKP